MGTNECSQSASKSSWDNQDLGDVRMVLKWAIFASPPGHNELIEEHCNVLLKIVNRDLNLTHIVLQPHV